jgi:hypothetical protein
MSTAMMSAALLGQRDGVAADLAARRPGDEGDHAAT